MKKRLRLLAWLITLTMLCELLPFSAFAQSDVGQQLALAAAQSLEEENSEAFATGKCGTNLNWSLSSDGTLTITGSGSMTSHPWTDKYTGTIRVVVLPSGLTSIASRAFYDCQNLIAVVPDRYSYSDGYAYIPENIVEIGDYAFYHCLGFGAIALFIDNLRTVGEGAFSQCSNVTDINILPADNDISSDEILTLGNVTYKPYAFAGCGVEEVLLLGCPKTISAHMFDGCSNLTDILLPSSVKTIDEGAFDGCYQLEDVYFAGTTSQWNKVGGSGKSALNSVNVTCLDSPGTDEPDEPDEPTEFTFGRDNLKFTNADSYFNRTTDGSVWDSFKFLIEYIPHKHSYQLSEEKFEQLTNGFSPRVKAIIRKQQQKNWGGSCHGMSSVIMLHYLDPSRIPLSQVQSSASTVYELDIPNQNQSVMDLINYYQFMQNLPSFYRYMSDCYTRYQNDVLSEVENIIASLRSGQPVFISLSNHAIVLLSIISETDNDCTVQVYDPNFSTPQSLTLYKYRSYSSTGKNSGIYPCITYETSSSSYTYIRYHILSRDIEFVDLRNYFGLNDYEKLTDYDDNHITVKKDGTFRFKYGSVYVRGENGKLVDISTGVQVYYPDGDFEEADTVEFVFPKSDTATFELEVAPDDYSNTDILLNDTLFSLATDGQAKLVYNESTRTADITADQPTSVNLLLTQNSTTSDAPWNSWAVDTTGTTSLNVTLDDEGLRLTGDGLSNAQYATENDSTGQIGTGTITDEPDEITGLISTTINPEPSIAPTPGGGSSSGGGGGGGGGAALLIGVGAAAAITAGVIMMSPVEIKGRVELADQTAVPGAKLSLLHEGKVMAQTTADENGSFSLKAKRGSYELTAAYTNADGQLIYKTIDIKVPAKDLTVTF